jgi:predicted AlkP superfamily pyrophosphatase or phosphodiesterase
MNGKRLKLLLPLALLFCCCRPAPQRTPRPKLILQITIDQLRGDEPMRYRDRFAARGFRYLLDEGTWYLSASHPHSHTETAVGHTTLATGAYPSVHGMIGDSWFDRDLGKSVDGVEDADYPLVGNAPCDAPLGKDDGDSPLRIQSTTFSDELAEATAGGAKIFAVSVKNRGAIPLAGHTGKAFWFCQATGDFVSSTFYYKSYPEWVTNWNRQKPADSFAGRSWELLNDRSTYLFKDLPPFAKNENLFGFNNVFPHPFDPPSKDRLFYTKLTSSPMGDELTLQFAEELIAREGLGGGDVPDYLAVSFSSTDIIGHNFGPSSLESEDNLLRLDRTLERLFDFVDKRVGLQNTLVVLAGDHGAPEVPEYLDQLHIKAGRLLESDVMNAATKGLKAHFGRDDLGPVIKFYKHPYIYLDEDLLKSLKLRAAEAEQAVAEAVTNVEGVAFAVPCGGEGEEKFDPDVVARIRRNQHPKRSGDVYVVQSPGWQVEEKSASGESSIVLINHGSPWAYDAFVPVAFAGMKVPAARVARQVYTVDVAPTLAALLGTDRPSGAVGVPLVEVFGPDSLAVVSR